MRFKVRNWGFREEQDTLNPKHDMDRLTKERKYCAWYVQKEQLGKMLDEDPSLMARREQIAKRLELYKSARDEIDSVAWK